MLNIAIIGGAGFIGTELCKRLSLRTDLKFIIIDLKKSSEYPQHSIICDIQDTDQLTHLLESSELVLNLAAEHKDNVYPVQRYYDVNVDGQKSLCDAMKSNDIKRLIFTSSVAVYGFVNQETDESGAIAPFNDYGKSKYEAEQVAKDRKYNFSQLSIVRPTVVFGTGNRGNVYNLLKQIASGKFLMIGNGENAKSMAYVENIAAFLEHLIDNNQGEEVFNYIDKPDFTMIELVKLVDSIIGRKSSTSIKLPYWLGYSIGIMFDLLSKITRKEFSVSSIRIKKFCSTTKFNSSCIDKTNFQPPVSFRQGLTKTIKNEFL